MAGTGECIDNPLTHQRIHHTQTAADTNGATFQMRFEMFMGAFIVGGPHLHSAQTETSRAGRLSAPGENWTTCEAVA